MDCMMHNQYQSRLKIYYYGNHNRVSSNTPSFVLCDVLSLWSLLDRFWEFELFWMFQPFQTKMAEISEKAEIADFSFFRFLSHQIKESVVFLQEIENLRIFRFYSHLSAISGNAEILVFSLFGYLSYLNRTWWYVLRKSRFTAASSKHVTHVHARLQYNKNHATKNGTILKLKKADNFKLRELSRHKYNIS